MTPASPPPGDAVALADALVRVDSRNPALAPDSPGEGACAARLAEVLGAWGFAVAVTDVLPGRPNVVARVGGGRGAADATGTPEAGGVETARLMLNGHLDTVGVEGMIHAPFAAERRGGRLYGRGSADMKSGIAAMCAAAWRAAHAGAPLPGRIVIAAVADEEHESAGTRALVEQGVRADAAIVTEPTRLTIAPAHRGFAWITVVVHGRAAHGSRYEIGVDAIRHAGLLLAELDRIDATVLPARTHPLLGHASLHASTIRGGIGWSTYPDRCELRIERRTLPGETADDARREVEAACAAVRARRPGFSADVSLEFAQLPSDVPLHAPIVEAMGAALRAAGEIVRHEGQSAWTDAALLNEAGIPAICYGPGDIALAHAAEEWIETQEIERATVALTHLIAAWCGGGNA